MKLVRTKDRWSIAILPELAGIEIMIDDNGTVKKFAADGDLEELKARLETELAERLARTNFKGFEVKW
jgi:hypothetical protein